ncbi:ABC transporter ATP-binding protein/permease [Methylobacterium sp. BTF04]|uniref:ABC transporter ATP-binding protein/permease n=1 Tax=Methylobacterium sp. BTF04 TaxID=2708300 RepID=UPI0013D081E0|nr:SbmA/BacA-like family transporter [Methylobacterium sp. BTF04]NEU12654.1 ABC transporter ATP-binding protein/permease [Methylobacterium sp. BTF04]
MRATDFRFAKVIIVYFTTEALAGDLLAVAQNLELVPVQLEIRKLAAFVITVCVFSIATYAVTFIPIIRKIFAIADRYFLNKAPVRLPILGSVITEGSIGAALLWLIIAIQQLEVLWHVNISYATAAISDALQSYDQDKFWHALLIQFPLYMGPYIAAFVVSGVLGSVLGIRWRRTLTTDYEQRWLSAHTHYKMIVAGVAVDNPDQRIQEDIPRFIDGSHGGRLGLFKFVTGLIQNFSSLITFAILLWILSGNFKIGGYEIPGLLLWATFLYAALTTAATALVGRSLASLLFANQHYEANFRFGLARLREYSEQVALLASEPAERKTFNDQMNLIVKNLYAIIIKQSMLSAFTQTLSNINAYLPYIVLGGAYFTREVTLGTIMQSMVAFSAVNGALTYFTSYYVALADFGSSVKRLTSFDEAIAIASNEAISGSVRQSAGGTIELRTASVLLPNGEALSEPLTLTLRPNEDLILTGPSGSGKSTLFRLIAGVWPYWSGTLCKPEACNLLVLPQKPYIPTGSLLQAVCYPASPEVYDRAEVESVMAALGLDALIPDLALDDNWAHRLSGGEQQRLGVARALLAKPAWLFLDEATSAQDKANEDRIYQLLKVRLPKTTIVSIAHKERLVSRHDRHLQIEKNTAGRFTLHEAPRVGRTPDSTHRAVETLA